jgi:hypothetical protein
MNYHFPHKFPVLACFIPSRRPRCHPKVHMSLENSNAMLNSRSASPHRTSGSKKPPMVRYHISISGCGHLQHYNPYPKPLSEILSVIISHCTTHFKPIPNIFMTTPIWTVIPNFARPSRPQIYSPHAKICTDSAPCFPHHSDAAAPLPSLRQSSNTHSSAPYSISHGSS